MCFCFQRRCRPANERFSTSTESCAPLLKWRLLWIEAPVSRTHLRSATAVYARFEAGECAFESTSNVRSIGRCVFVFNAGVDLQTNGSQRALRVVRPC